MKKVFVAVAEKEPIVLTYFYSSINYLLIFSVKQKYFWFDTCLF